MGNDNVIYRKTTKKKVREIEGFTWNCPMCKKELFATKKQYNPLCIDCQCKDNHDKVKRKYEFLIGAKIIDISGNFEPEIEYILIETIDKKRFILSSINDLNINIEAGDRIPEV